MSYLTVAELHWLCTVVAAEKGQSKTAKEFVRLLNAHGFDILGHAARPATFDPDCKLGESIIKPRGITGSRIRVTCL